MAKSALDELLDALGGDRPAVLFLGQNFGLSSDGRDLVLEALCQRAGVDSPWNWSRALDGRALTEDDCVWLAERFDRNVLNEGVERVFSLAWSAVFTTSVDQRISQRLETRGRVAESILSRDHFARAVRSRSRPAVHFLYGKASENQSDYRVPRNPVERMRRQAAHVIPLLNRIAETSTPLGVVVLEGYDPSEDWLHLDSLLAPLSASPGPRVLWFGRPKGAIGSPLLVQMEQEGSLISDARSLAAALAASDVVPESSGAVFQAEAGTLSLPGGSFLKVSPTLRLRTEAAAAVVDDSWVEDQDGQYGSERAEEAFRRFHGDFGGPRSTVDGIRRGFAIEREFEAKLFAITTDLLRKTGEVETFIILHGQSGSGKSIAMARLALKLRRAPVRIPVLFAWGRVPGATELDDFCEECERAGAFGTVVLCDSNEAYTRYRDLALALKSRGRRIVVVGTAYKVEDEKLRNDSRFVEAPDLLSPAETADLKALLLRFGSQDVARLEAAATGEHFLALLYRYLSASRARLAGGVSGEARFTEDLIRFRAKAVPRAVTPRTQLAHKLIAAGLVDGEMAIFEDDSEAAAQGADAAARFVDYVMAAGRLDCPVPLNLVIRAIRAESEAFELEQIGYLFGELDLFRWKSGDPEGNSFLIQPRLQLEAELICRRRMGSFEYELDCVLSLISSVRSTSIDADIEVSCKRLANTC